MSKSLKQIIMENVGRLVGIMSVQNVHHLLNTLNSGDKPSGFAKKRRKNMSRKSTNSLTHLCKIIAREEANDVFNERKHELKAVNEPITIRIDPTHSLEKIRNKLHNIGGKWERWEDDLLVKEVTEAIKQIASNHGRTEGAIQSRIHQKSIMYGGK